jgi:SPP1 family predicted phage head-tail adaptor
MRAGELRERITLQRRVAGVASLAWGESDAAQWEDVCMVSAAVYPLSARERLQAGSIQTEADYRLRLRFNPSINSQHRIRWKQQILDIKAVIDVAGRHRELEILAQQTAEVTA